MKRLVLQLLEFDPTALGQKGRLTLDAQILEDAEQQETSIEMLSLLLVVCQHSLSGALQ